MTLAGFATLVAVVLALVVLAGVVYGGAYAAWAERRWPPEGRLVDTTDGVLHVVDAGEGPAIVLVHGAAANNREMRSALEAPLVEAGFRVLAVDRPGFGGSPPRRGSDRLGVHASAIAALIDAEELERPIVIGHSYGGAVVLRLALEHPRLVGGLVLLGPATHGDVGPASWFNYVGDAPVIGWVFARAVVPIAGPLMARDGLDGAFAPQTAPHGHAAATGVGLLFRPASFAANSADLAHVNAEMRAQQDRYHEIEAPVAIVAGTEDRTVLTARHSERTAAAIENARLTILPDVGHMPHHAAPGLIVEHVSAIAESLEATP